MGSNVLFEVIFAAEFLATIVARMGPNSGVNQLVSGELFVAGESLITGWEVALKGSLACVNSDMIFELAVVGKGSLTDGTLEVFGPMLFRRLALLLLLLFEGAYW